MKDPRFEIVDDDQQGFHARYISGGQIIWWTESYTRKENASHAINSIKRGAAGAAVYDMTATAAWRRRAA